MALPTLAVSIPWAAIAPLLVLVVAFQIYCLVDLAGAEVQYLPKWGWGLVILLANPLGGVVYLLAGRRTT